MSFRLLLYLLYVIFLDSSMAENCGEFPRSLLIDVYSSIAQWQSIRLLTEGLLVRAQLGEVDSSNRASFI